ncbi:MAG: 4Fe-4S dicluster domain-containing protein [Rhodospirillales bacterium]|nr:4Fe-4S dicluster domain-containing protein [Rhodospirillales bacterium]MCW8953197.1 4Fe-4S dicluster domain-containing protein [Rhodospirillales bacterium]MCW9002524.1 4Fe-4S dicluster domain-containing protein [Rhodospirillales bacterium]
MNEITKKGITRRELLSSTAGAAAGAAAIATGAGPAEAAAAEVPRWGMVMDLRKCIGCRACTVSCKSENDVSLGRFRTVIQEKTHGTFPNTKKGFLPLMCNHCEGNEKDGVPPCVKACPEFPGERATFIAPNGKKIRYRSGGTYKRPDGLILVDAAQCVGCGKCIDACPYGVRSFNPYVKAGKDPTKQAADKCTMCAHRIDNGVEPSCVNTCQGRARIFGDLNDPDSNVSKLVKEHNLAKNVLLPEEGTHPQLFYVDPNNELNTLYTKRQKGKLDHFVDQIP